MDASITSVPASTDAQTGVKRCVKPLMALVFLPVQHVVVEFESLRTNEMSIDQSDAQAVTKLHDLNMYFSYNWLALQ